MERRTKTYWQEFLPLWRQGFKLWIGGGTWGQSITSIVFAIGVPLLYLYFEEVDIGLENLRQLGFATLIGIFWYFIIGIITYIGANIRLYQKQVENRKELGEFLENPYRIEIHPPSITRNRDRPLYHSLEIHNDSAYLQIEDCQVQLKAVFFTNTKKPPDNLQQYLLWDDREHNDTQRWSQAIKHTTKRLWSV